MQVRKRPLNKKELARKEEDIISIKDIESSLTVHEPKVKVCNIFNHESMVIKKF